MNSDWEQLSIAELSNNFDKDRIPVKGLERSKGPYPYYGASGIVDWVNNFIFDGEYLLVAEDGENLRSRKTPIAFIAKGKFWVNNHAHILQGNEKSNTKFLCYALESKNISGYITGTTIPKLSRGNLDKILVSVPSLNKQKAIVDIIDTLDNKIELNKKTKVTLEDIAKTLFKSWFIDFDPVRAKAEGRSTGLPDEISNLFPDSFIDSELGMIPKNWNYIDLSEIAEFQNGYGFKSSEYIQKSETSLEVFRMGYIQRGGGFKEDNSPVYAETSSKGYQKKYAIEKNDLTIAMTDMKDKMAILGCCALIEESNRFLLNQRVGRIRVRENRIVDSKYLYLFMNYQKNIDLIRSKSNSGVQVNLSTEVIKTTRILIPEIPVMEQFSKISNDLFSNIFNKNKSIKVLSEVRDSLLPKLISGELRIPDAEKIIEEEGI